MVSLLLGLGNVGQKYARTRHNVGFWVLNNLVLDYRVHTFLSTDEYHQAVLKKDESEIIMAQPNRYMNNSGFAAKALLQQYSLKPSEMLVIVDDFQLPIGALRIRHAGSDGGHNGLASIIEQIGTDQFPRLRLGIGNVTKGSSVVDFVLGEFDEDEQIAVTKMIATASEAALACVHEGVEKAMQKYNKNPV